MLPKPWFSKPIFGHSAGSTEFDRPYCKRFWSSVFRNSTLRCFQLWNSSASAGNKRGLVLRTPFSPYSIQKHPEPQICPKICPSDCFSGFQSGGLKFVKNLSKFVRNCRFSNFNKFLTNFSPPDWNPEKQSLGQILDKFGVRSVFECCKGKKGSQVWCIPKDCFQGKKEGKYIYTKEPSRCLRGTPSRSIGV